MEWRDGDLFVLLLDWQRLVFFNILNEETNGTTTEAKLDQSIDW